MVIPQKVNSLVYPSPCVTLDLQDLVQEYGVFHASMKACPPIGSSTCPALRMYNFLVPRLLYEAIATGVGCYAHGSGEGRPVEARDNCTCMCAGFEPATSSTYEFPTVQ